MKTKEKIKKLSIILIFLTLSLILLTGCGKEKNVEAENTNYTKALEYICSGLETADSATYLKAFPKVYQKEYEDMYDDDTLENMLESFEEEYGNNIKISYEILDKEEIDENDLKYVQEALEDKFEDNDTVKKSDLNVTAGYKLLVKLKIQGDDDSETSTGNMKVYKIGGKWCLLSTSFL